MPALLSIRNLSYITSDNRSLFENLDLVFDRERTALIGANGVGKTTLFNLITGTLSPTTGTISSHGTLGLLPQNLDPRPGETITDIFAVTEDYQRLQRVLAGEGSLEDTIEADWTLEPRLEQALADVGLPNLRPEHPISDLSGGQRTRLALAALIFAQPDMILLDEPTNNLDEAGRKAIAKLMGGWRSGAIIISHDRALLRQVDRIIELTQHGVKIYGGNWDFYKERKAMERAAAEATLAHSEKELAQTAKKTQVAREKKAQADSRGKSSRDKGGAPKILLNAKRNRAEGTTGRLSAIAQRQQDDAKRAADEARENVERLQAPSVSLPPTHLPYGKTVLQIDNVHFGYQPENLIFKDFSLRITGPERIALTGPNGSGKTTMLGLISGALTPQTGTVRCTDHMTMLDQHANILDHKATIRDNFRRLNPTENENACRAALARFLFRADAATRTVNELSGGEKLRAALACTLGSANPPELLILDEPTNHLDLTTIAAMEAGLSAYDGALLVSSHDNDFLQNIAITRSIVLPPANPPST